MRAYAGIGDVRRAGLSVKEASQWLLRLAAVERQLLHIPAGPMQGIPEWDVKVTVARHLWEDAEHADQLFTRIDQLRAHAEHHTHALRGPLGLLLEEALRARDTVEYLVGVYRVLKPALVAAYERYLATTNPLADQPSVRVLRAILAEEREQLDLAAGALDDALAAPERRAAAEAWEAHLRAYLAAAGGVLGDGPAR